MAGKKKIVVTGASGRLGSELVEALGERGHEVVPASRRSGVDVISGEGLGEALAGADLIIDTATSPNAEEREATEFFITSARNLHSAAAEHGVGEIYAVSIIGCEHFATGYYAAKRTHELAHLSGPVPVRILRSAQFHEFVSDLVMWGTQGDTSHVGPMRTQLIAVRSVAETLADMVDGADGAPLGSPVCEVAGPREEKLVDVARLLVKARGEELTVEVGEAFDDPEDVWSAGGLLPGPLAKLTGPTFEEWVNR